MLLSRLFPWLGSLLLFLLGWQQPGPSGGPDDDPNTATPAVSGLPAAVAAGGMFLSSMAAALVSASASATGVAPVASAAFTNLGRDGLAGTNFVNTDWRKIALEAGKESSGILDRFYVELEREQKELAFVLRLAELVADRIRDERVRQDTQWWFTRRWAAIWGGEQKELERICRRALDLLLDLAKDTRSTHALYQQDASNLQLNLNKRVGVEGRHHAMPRRDGFFQQGVKRLNQRFAAGGAGWPSGSEHCEQDSQQAAANDGQCRETETGPANQAAFVMDLHTANGAEAMFHEAFQNAQQRLGRLSDLMEDKERWMANNDANLARLDRELGETKSLDELRLVVDEVLSLAEEWRSMNQEQFYAE